MESLVAIGVGLVLRVVLDVATDNDDKVGGVLVGLWEGVVFNHFVRRMPHSFDPYIGFGFRIFVDFLFTQSLSRLALVALWSLVGMLLADIAPNVWRDSGLRHLYRQVRKDVRHVKRAVPRIRIENDLPSVRLFNRSRSTSTEVSGSSIRSDRAAPSRSPAPSPAPTLTPARRQGRSPPGTFPDVSGWSETGTDISRLSLLRERIVTNPASPALIPSREFVAGERSDATHVTTVETQTTTVRDTTVTITQTQTQKESMQSETVLGAAVLGATALSPVLESIDDPSRHEPPTIPDDWVDIHHPTPVKANEPVPPFQPDSDSTPEHQPTPSTPTPSRPASVFVPPPAIEVLPDIPDVDAGNRASRPPAQIPLPESRAASVIGSVVGQPEPLARSVLREQSRSRVDKATSEIGSVVGRPKPQSAPREKSRSRTDKAASEIGGVVVQPELQSTSREDPRSRVDKPASVIGSVVGQPEPQSALREDPRSRVDKAASEIGSVVDQPEPRSTLRENPRSRADKAASEIGGVYDQAEPHSALRGTLRPRMDKAASEIGGVYDQSEFRRGLHETSRSHVDKAADRAAYIATQSSKTQSSRGWMGFSSWGLSKPKQATDTGAPLPPPKETHEEPAGQSKPDEASAVQGPEPLISTPAQVDPPVNILTQPGDAPPLLLTTDEPKPMVQGEQTQTSKPELTPILSAGVDTSPGLPQGEADKVKDKDKDKGGDAGARKDSLFDVPTPSQAQPPPYSEFAGVAEGPSAGEVPAEEDPLTQDEEAETELTQEQKAAEEKRHAFLTAQLNRLEGSRSDLQKKLEDDDASGSEAKALESDIEDMGNTLNNIKARVSKKKFSQPQSSPSIPEVDLANKSATETESALTSAVLNMLLTRDDAGPMTIQATINKQKPLKGKAIHAKDAVHTFAKRHKFWFKSETKTPGIINITF